MDNIDVASALESKSALTVNENKQPVLSQPPDISSALEDSRLTIGPKNKFDTWGAIKDIFSPTAQAGPIGAAKRAEETFLKDPERKLIQESPDEGAARAKNIYALSKVTGFPMSEVEQHYEDFARNPKITGIKPDQPSTKEYVAGLMNLGIAAGAVMDPIGTAVGFLTFSAIDHVIPTEKFIPLDASPTARDSIRLMDFILKVELAGKMMSGLPEGRPNLGDPAAMASWTRANILEKFSYFKMRSKGLPSTIDISADHASKILDAVKPSGEHITNAAIIIGPKKMNVVDASEIQRIDVALERLEQERSEAATRASKVRSDDLSEFEKRDNRTIYEFQSKQRDLLDRKKNIEKKYQGNVYEAEHHKQAIQKAEAAGEDISKVDQEKDGLLKTSLGRLLTRDEAEKEFGIRHSEQIPTLPENILGVTKQDIETAKENGVRLQIPLEKLMRVATDEPKTFKLKSGREARTLLEKVRKEGGLDPKSVEAAGYKLDEDLKQFGAHSALKNIKNKAGKLKLDSYAAELVKTGELFPREGETPSAALIRNLQTKGRDILQNIKDRQENYEAEYAKTIDQLRQDGFSNKEIANAEREIEADYKRESEIGFDEENDGNLDFDFGENVTAWDQVKDILSTKDSSKLEINPTSPAEIKFPEEESPLKETPETPKKIADHLEAARKNIESQKGQLNVGMIPGAGEIGEVAETAGKVARGVQQVFAPATIDQYSKMTAEVLREEIAKSVRAYDVLEQALARAKNIFEKLKKEKALDFMDRMEKGDTQETPEFQKIADTIRKELDRRREEIQDLGTGKLDKFIENYFPHIWKDPKKAMEVLQFDPLARIGSRRPFEGSKAFLKQRTIESLREGVAKGLEPVSWNPVDLVLLKAREMDKYLLAHRSLNIFKDEGYAKFFRIGAERPSHWEKIDDKISTVFRHVEGEGLVLTGHYYMEPNAARVLNNYLSPGLRGNIFYDLYRGAGNTLNQFQLSGLFHLGFTSLDACVSKAAIGFEKVMGKNISGLGDIMQALAGVPALTTLVNGDRVLKAWYGRPTDAKAAVIAEAMVTGGGRARMDTFYATKAWEGVKASLKEGKMIKGIMQAPLAAVEATVQPILKEIVPRQKMGVFFDLMQNEIEKNPNLSHAEFREKAQKAWDSVDNRLGQLVYDNLFWDKTTKDLLMAGIRSVGWNLGTMREVGGGLVDTLKFAKDLKAGKNPEFTHKMAYVLALPMIVGFYGAVYQYLHTGILPQETKDYFYPMSGKIDTNGKPQRISLPSYMKDIYAYGTQPWKTITNKIAPQNSMIAQMLENKDYYGTKIRNEDDPLMQQIFDEMKFTGEQFVPFTLRKAYQKQNFSAEQIIGIMPAPSRINMTKAEIAAQKYMEGKIPVGARTKEASEHSQKKADVRNQFMQDRKEAAVYKAVSDGIITEKEADTIVDQVDMSYLERVSKYLTVEEAVKVYNKSNPKEKEVLRPMIEKKYQNRMRKQMTPEQEKRLDSLMGDFFK